ncbi:acyltransferase family protein [Sphingomonas sp. 4RDLI-65]|uniref:acyltransferase family protein n=1 Tax=Sphingomonas sp. 4RDLI-65 TaxID=3111641 RepID=UPI003C1C7DAD
MTSGPPSTRIEGLSVWRAVLMLGGVVLHGAMGLEHLPVFAAIPLISHAFRMGSFMLISGLLCGYALARRRSPLAWLGRRSIQLGVPLSVGLLVICPLIGWMLDDVTDRNRWPFAIAHDWYHLWFLVALLAYAPLSYAFHRIDRRHDVVGKLEQGLVAGRLGRSGSAQTIVLLTAAVACCALMMVTRQMLAGRAPPLYAAALSHVQLMLGYAPFYLLGFLLARSPMLYRILTASIRTPIVILVAVGCVYALWFGGVSAMLGPTLGPIRQAIFGDLIELIGMSLCPPAASVLILRSAVSIRTVPLIVRRLADASFTIYVLHFPIIIALKIALRHVPWNPYVEFTITIAIASLTTYLAHILIVERFPVMSFLLNGRYPEPAKTRAAAEI